MKIDSQLVADSSEKDALQRERTIYEQRREHSKQE